MTNKRPAIGVTTSINKSQTMWLCNNLAVWIAGGKAIRLTTRNYKNYREYNGYLISGGVDIDPTIYNEENIASIGIEKERDKLEFEVINHALENNKPLFGICRGAQMINIVMGGNLYQNARDIYKDFLPTSSTLGKAFLRRKVNITAKGIISKVFANKKQISVNSIHHQAINQLGKGLKITAKDRHNIVQTIESSDAKSYILGLQWHPEFMLYKKKQRKVFQSFIDACKM